MSTKSLKTVNRQGIDKTYSNFKYTQKTFYGQISPESKGSPEESLDEVRGLLNEERNIYSFVVF